MRGISLLPDLADIITIDSPPPPRIIATDSPPPRAQASNQLSAATTDMSRDLAQVIGSTFDSPPPLIEADTSLFDQHSLQNPRMLHPQVQSIPSDTSPPSLFSSETVLINTSVEDGSADVATMLGTFFPRTNTSTDATANLYSSAHGTAASLGVPSSSAATSFDPRQDHGSHPARLDEGLAQIADVTAEPLRTDVSCQTSDVTSIGRYGGSLASRPQPVLTVRHSLHEQLHTDHSTSCSRNVSKASSDASCDARHHDVVKIRGYDGTISSMFGAGSSQIGHSRSPHSLRAVIGAFRLHGNTDDNTDDDTEESSMRPSRQSRSAAAGRRDLHEQAIVQDRKPADQKRAQSRTEVTTTASNNDDHNTKQLRDFEQALSEERLELERQQQAFAEERRKRLEAESRLAAIELAQTSARGSRVYEGEFNEGRQATVAESNNAQNSDAASWRGNHTVAAKARFDSVSSQGGGMASADSIASRLWCDVAESTTSASPALQQSHSANTVLSNRSQSAQAHVAHSLESMFDEVVGLLEAEGMPTQQITPHVTRAEIDRLEFEEALADILSS